MMPQDVHGDEIGSPDDGQGQGKPPTITGEQP